LMMLSTSFFFLVVVEQLIISTANAKRMDVFFMLY